jgi:hypothetical protein
MKQETKSVKEYLDAHWNINDEYFDEEEPNPDDGLLILAVLFWIVLIICLVLLGLYSLYDFFFVGTPFFRVFAPITSIVLILIYRWWYRGS